MNKDVQNAYNTSENIQKKLVHLVKMVDEIKNTAVRALKNQEMDNTVLTREINRMTHIDRLKVAHAKDLFFNPDSKEVLPSLDKCLAVAPA